MQHCDAVVVGGGPAGSSAARDLVRAGLDVVVIERAPFPRDKPCAGWITPPVLSTLDIDPSDYAGSGRTLQPIQGFRVGVCGGPTTAADFGTVVSYGIRRCEFDQYLLERSGARVEMGTAVKRLERTRGRWIVNERVETPLLIGAGGHFCPVAAALAPSRTAGPLVVAQEIEVPLSDEQARRCRAVGTLPALFFCQDLKGYGWLFRKQGFLNVGFGRQDVSQFTRRAAAFMAWLVEAGELPPGIAARWRGHAYLLRGRPERPPVGDGVLLVGDAAGLAYPVSGEGIRTAVESGRLAAAAVVASGGMYVRQRLEAYREMLDGRYGRPAHSDGRLRWLPACLAQPAGRGLIRTRWFARHVLAARWFLHMEQASLS